jgi:hypothetical protein
MRLPQRDLLATGLVAVAGLLYGLWAAEAGPPGLDSLRATGLVMLVLGFAASASAVVPGFEQLLHGNKLYLGVNSALGLVALAAGVLMLVASSEVGLAVLMVTMVAMWLIATVHHVVLAEAALPRPPRHRPRPA